MIEDGCNDALAIKAAELFIDMFINGKKSMEAEKEFRIYDGATAIITDGASGIGQAIAKELAKKGCEVVLADRQFELAQKVAAGIRAAGGKATAVELDVKDRPSVEKVVRDTVCAHRETGLYVQ
ncbi:MAG: SDR family NAD(P)-dependent oxidoreductase [Desulfosudis oleivorans]|nr:SDR family NAD(P)-dependent oxidoreductase [Desulfosudis oleivorans]